MTSPAITVTPSQPLSDVIALMVRNKLSGVPVVEADGSLVGILSEGDLMRRIELGTASVKGSWWSRIFSFASPAEIYRRTNGRKVSDVMTANAVTINSTDTLAEAARVMQNFKVKRMPVMTDGVLAGMLTRADFMTALGCFLAKVYDEPGTSDDEIKTRIKAEIDHQDWGVNCGLRIAVKHGNVTLSGLAPSNNKRAAAVVAAENVIGVKSVEDVIEVVEAVALTGL